MIVNDPAELAGTRAFDVCIVGTGPAGMTIARSLPRSLRIALIEAGGFEYAAEDQKNYEGEASDLRPGYLSTSRARMFGGSSNCWGGWCHPLDDYDLQRKDWLDASVTWPIDRQALIPYYDKASKLLGLESFFGGERDWRALTADASDSVDLRLVPFQVSTPPMRFGTQFRAELERAENIFVCLHSNAAALECRPDGRVRALQVVGKAGNRVSIEAGFFVLATGGIENARILLNSTDVHAAGLGNQHDQVGRHFMAHTPVWGAGAILFAEHDSAMLDRIRTRGVLNFLSLSDQAKRREGLLNLGLWLQYERAHQYAGQFIVRKLDEKLNDSGLGTRLDSIMGGDRDYTARTIAAFMRSIGDHDNTAIFSFLAVPETAADPDNRVTLAADTDPLGIRKVQVKFRPTDLDESSFRRSLSLIARILGRQTLGRMRISYGADNPAVRQADEHHMGTTRMHEDPRRGVVDRNCVVHGAPNLYVAGSSVFASSGFANPTFTILALAYRIADHLAAAAR
jgi:choline dehydrogenase-like flavoprotein